MPLYFQSKTLKICNVRVSIANTALLVTGFQSLLRRKGVLKKKKKNQALRQHFPKTVVTSRDIGICTKSSGGHCKKSIW